MVQPLSVLQFTDYRAYLFAHSQQMKRKSPRWSYGSWAKRLHLKSTSSLTKVLQGKREPGEKMTSELVRYFNFARSESQYFRDLVQLNKIRRDPHLSVLVMERMQRQHPKGSVRLLGEREFALLSQWHHFALREMTNLADFTEDHEALSRRFLFKITPRDIRLSIETL